MEIVILGSGTGYPSPRREPSGLLIRVGAVPLLFDAGSGTLGRLTRAGVDLDALEYIHFSHKHPDHCADLVPILLACYLMRRTRPLHVVSSPSFFDYMAAAIELNPSARHSGYELRQIDITQSPFSGPAWSVAAAPTGHTPESLAFRVAAEGKTVVYTGDAIATPALAEFARGADLLIAECSFPEDSKQPSKAFHLSPSQIGAIAEGAGARRLLLTHFYPECDGLDIVGQTAKWYSGPITIAEDGLRFVV